MLKLIGNMHHRAVQWEYFLILTGLLMLESNTSAHFPEESHTNDVFRATVAGIFKQESVVKTVFYMRHNFSNHIIVMESLSIEHIQM